MPIKFDMGSAIAGLDKLADPKRRESLARRMAVEGGAMFRDEAKSRAPEGDPANPGNQFPVKKNKSGAMLKKPRPASGERPGTLRDAIYLAYSEKRSTESHVVYSVTWNSKKAPHGHLAEFGHWQRYRVRRDLKGRYYTTNELLPQPKFITTNAGWLAASLEAVMVKAKEKMILRGNIELTNLLKA